MKKTLPTIVSLFFSLFIFAQDASFAVQLDRDTILMGNHFTVSFKLENASGQQFSPPAFENFDVIGGPNQSSSVMMVNGDVTQSIAYTYILSPKAEGRFFIDPAKIKTKSGDLFTEPLAVNIYPNPDGIIQQPRQNHQSFWDIDFFSMPQFPDIPEPPATPEPKPKKKKRKTYKL